MRRLSILVVVPIVLVVGGCVSSPVDRLEARIARVENGLLRDSGAPAWQRMNLSERMAVHNVPGVSIAVIDDFRIEWARGYGVTQRGGSDPVTVATLFQVASIAKPLVAVAALHYVEQGVVDLDRDVNDDLVSWRVSENAFTAEAPVTLRRLLSHTAGVTVHGFRGYAQGETIPSLQQILEGEPPANSPPIIVDTVPGERFRYSGGGYMIVQQLLEDGVGKPFPEIVEDAVLEPWKMTNSTLESPLPESLRPIAASGHRADGSPISGGWHTYPEMGAGGSMWSTPSDMARFAIGVMLAYRGRSHAVLSPAMALEMLTPQLGGREGPGLGPFVSDDGGDRFYFMHDGGNDGYKSFMVAYPKRGQGIIIMTNSDGGNALWQEILHGVSAEYGWLRNDSYLYVGATAVLLLVLAAGTLLWRRRARRRQTAG